MKRSLVLLFFFLGLSTTLAGVIDGRTYIQTLEHLAQNPPSSSVARAQLADELRGFELGAMNRGLTSDDRIALSRRVLALLKTPGLSSYLKIFAVRAGSALMPEGSKPGPSGDPVRFSMVGEFRALILLPPDGRFSLALRDEAIAGLQNMGEASVHGIQSYVEKLTELASLFPEGKPPLKPARREALTQAFEAFEWGGEVSFDEIIPIEERMRLGDRLGNLFNHSNENVQRLAIEGFGGLFAKASRGRAPIDEILVQELRRFANFRGSGPRLAARKERAATALRRIESEKDATPFFEELGRVYRMTPGVARDKRIGELKKADLETLIGAMARSERFRLAQCVTRYLRQDKDPEVHRLAIEAARLLIPGSQMLRLTVDEQGIRQELANAIKSHTVLLSQARIVVRPSSGQSSEKKPPRLWSRWVNPALICVSILKNLKPRYSRLPRIPQS